MQKIKKGDEVIMITGKHKGRKGPVLSVKGIADQAVRVLVEGLNLIKRHEKPNPNQQKPGGIVEKEAYIDISNVAIVNPKTGKADRVGFKILEDGRKVRVFKSTGEVIDV